ncbi:MAG: SRPBCC domain-containing protein, partial [Planctomycetes bacterium]|nr:SRPBCC domain-containing protein [Planctomycetota bacterium]
SSWFVPTEVEEREDGTPARVVSHFGPGMDAIATPTAWDPPRRFAAESQDLGPNAPPIATEWIVEARSGGTCVVRVVHSLFASSDDWDNQLESFESGWPWFFRILRLYLTHFPGQRCSAFRAMGFAPEPESEAWDALTGPLGLAGVTVGQRWNASTGSPPFAGLVERTGEGGHPHGLLLQLDEPVPGIVSLFAHNMGGQVCLVIDFYLYGDRAAAAVARHEPSWHAWMKERFPSAGDASCVT